MHPAKINADGVDLERLLRRYSRLGDALSGSDSEKQTELQASQDDIRAKLMAIKAKIDEVLQ